MKKKNEKSNSKFEPLSFSEELARTVLDALSAHIAILDDNGIILETNRAWRNFSMNSGISVEFDYRGVNYLDICDATTGEGLKSIIDTVWPQKRKRARVRALRPAPVRRRQPAPRPRAWSTGGYPKPSAVN